MSLVYDGLHRPHNHPAESCLAAPGCWDDIQHQLWKTAEHIPAEILEDTAPDTRAITHARMVTTFIQAQNLEGPEMPGRRNM